MSHSGKSGLFFKNICNLLTPCRIYKTEAWILCEGRSLNAEIERVLRDYSDMIYKIALVRTKHREDAEDILQDVLVKYMLNTKPFESEEHERAWLIRVTINASNKLLTNSWAKRVTSLEDLSDLTDGALGGFETRAENDVYQAVLNLPVKYRDPIHLFYY